MTEVEAAEKLLKQAKLEEKTNRQFKELTQLKEIYEGKCFGSHTFTKANSAAYTGAVYYEQFYIKDNEIYVTEWVLNSSRYKLNNKSSKILTSFSRTINENRLTGEGNSYNASYYLSASNSYCNKPIPKEKFMQLWETSENLIREVEKEFTKKLPELRTEFQRLGDERAESTMETIIKLANIEVIDLNAFPIIQRCLEYTTLPFFESKRWLPKIYAAQLLNGYVKKLELENLSTFTYAAREHNARIIYNLKEFIKNNL